MLVAFLVSLVWRETISRSPRLVSRQRHSSQAGKASSRSRSSLFRRLTFIYLGDVLTRKRNRLIDSSTKAVLLIKSWLGRPEAERWEIDLNERAEGDVEDTASVSDGKSVGF
jgi:hypothetical protein